MSRPSALRRTLGESLRSPRARRLGWLALAAFALYGLLGVFGVPPLVRHFSTHELSRELGRPIQVGNIRFNPFTLNLTLDDLRIAEPDGSAGFVEVGRLSINAAASSLLRRAPMLDALSVERPRLHLVRGEPRRLNISDLIERLVQPASAEPTHFSLSNIQVIDGSLKFEDRVLGTEHSIERFQLGVPFIADLPAQTEVFVEPLLSFLIDGNPQHLAGKTKPYASTREGVLEIGLNGIDLPRYLAYLPDALPVRVADGVLSGGLQIRFGRDANQQPQISVSGTLDLDRLALHDRDDAPLLELAHARAALTDVQPLRRKLHLRALELDGLVGHWTRRVVGPADAVAAPAAAVIPPAAKTVTPDLVIAELSLANGGFRIIDVNQDPPAEITLEDAMLQAHGVRTQGPAAPFTFAARLAGGKLAARGKLDLEHRSATTALDAAALDLTQLQALARPTFAGTIERGALGFDAQLRVDFPASGVDVHVEPATLTVDGCAIRGDAGAAAPVQFERLRLEVESLALADATIALAKVELAGLQLALLRARDGTLNVAQLLAAAPAGGGAAGSVPAWKVSLASGAIEQAAIHLEDAGAAQPVKLDLKPLTLKLQDLAEDHAQPFKLQVEGGFGRKGSYKLDGTVALEPAQAQLRVDATRLDLAPLEPYVAGSLNASIKSAVLSAAGALKLDAPQGKPSLRYQGDATLGDVRMLDKLSGDDFLRWKALSAGKLDFAYADEQPRVNVEALALADFYARVIINASGKLNLTDIVAAAAEPAVSLTRVEPAPAAAPAAAPATASAAAPASAAEIAIGHLTLQGGRINYTDNYIQPHFTADVTDIIGKVGAFGTASTAPAAVSVQGKLGQTAPIDIGGLINPLAPTAFVDLRAKADGVELTQLTPYSAKYAGFPIVQGTLNLDVHYLLDQGKLSADNHLFIDQLTLGDKVESPDATRLPVQLAIALLKNARGEIDLTIPVSGSLSDPQFSFGGVVVRAFASAIASAVTSPFRLLAAAFGQDEDFSYVDFAPGSAALRSDGDPRLVALAKALADRPGLKLQLAGRVDAQIDRPALRQASLERQVKAAKLAANSGKAPLDPAAVDAVVVEPEEYDDYLERAYKAADFPKPRNFIGLNKSLPPEEMKALMLAHIEVGDADLQRLAQQRAQAVHDWLAEKVDASRLHVSAAESVAAGGDEDDNGNTARVEFALK